MNKPDYLFSTACVLVSVSIFSATSLLAKLLGTGRFGEPLHPVQIACCRFFFAFLAVALIATVLKPQLRNAPWRLHIQRSIFGWLGVSCLFAAAIQIPLADANAISFLSIIIAMALSVFFLGERVGVTRWSAAILALVGATIISRPGASAFHPAALLALLSAVFIGFESIFLKKLSNSQAPIQILLLNNTFGSLVSLAVAPFFWMTPNSAQWLGLAAVGILMALTQYFNTLALSRSDISYVAPFWYSAPLFAVFFDYFLFDHLVTLWSAVGIALIMCGGITITYREGRRHESSKV